MNIFITGASGFVGRNLLSVLDSDTRIEKILILQRTKNNFSSKKIVTLHGDLASLNDTKSAFKIDMAIHMAALMRTSNWNELHATNVLGTQAVCNFCTHNNIQKLLFLSSINVLLPNIHKGYAESKQLAEKIISTSGIPYLIFRPGLIIGNSSPDDAIMKILHCIKKFHIFPIIGNGAAIEQPIYVGDVVQFILAGIFSLFTNSCYELGGEQFYTYNALIDMIAKKHDVHYLKIHLPEKFTLALIQCCEKLNIPIPLTKEQILHQITDLKIDNSSAIDAFNIRPVNICRYII